MTMRADSARKPEIPSRSLPQRRLYRPRYPPGSGGSGQPPSVVEIHCYRGSIPNHHPLSTTDCNVILACLYPFRMEVREQLMCPQQQLFVAPRTCRFQMLLEDSVRGSLGGRALHRRELTLGIEVTLETAQNKRFKACISIFHGCAGGILECGNRTCR